MGRLSEAIDSYKAALAREAEFPNLQTLAYLDLPYLIATRGLREKYDDTIQLPGKVQSALGVSRGIPGRSLSMACGLRPNRRGKRSRR